MALYRLPIRPAAFQKVTAISHMMMLCHLSLVHYPVPQKRKIAPKMQETKCGIDSYACLGWEIKNVFLIRKGQQKLGHEAAGVIHCHVTRVRVLLVVRQHGVHGQKV